MNDRLVSFEMLKFVLDGEEDPEPFVKSLEAFLVTRGFLSYKQMAILSAKAERKLLILKIREHYGVTRPPNEKEEKELTKSLGKLAKKFSWGKRKGPKIVDEHWYCGMNDNCDYPDKDY